MARKLLFGFVTILAVALLVWGCSDDETPVVPDETPPAITDLVGFPEDDALICGPLTITGTATDTQSNIATVVLYLDGNEIASVEPDPATKEFDFEFTDITIEAPGGRVIGTLAIDAFDTENQHHDGYFQTASVDVINDGTAPAVTITAPLNGELIYCYGDTLFVDIVEENLLETIELFVNTGSYSTEPTLFEGTDTYFFILEDGWAGDAGSYTLAVAATDQCGNVGNHYIDVDYECPVLNVQVLTPAEGEELEVGVDYPFSASATFDLRELPDVESIAFYFDSSPSPFCTDYDGADGWVCIYNIGYLTLGTHTVYIIANTSDGAEHTSSAVPFVVIQSPRPDVTIISPQSGSLLCGIVTFSATVEFPVAGKSAIGTSKDGNIGDRDVTVESVEFFFDSSQNPFCTGYPMGGNTWTCDYDVSEMLGTSHWVSAVANLSDNTSVGSLSVEFIKTCPPVLNMNYTVNSSLERNVELDASGSWDDNHLSSPPAPLHYSWSSTPAAVITPGASGLGAPYEQVTFDWDEDTYGYGDYEVCLTITDMHGISNDMCITVWINDETGPVLNSYYSPSNNSVVGDFNVPVTFGVTGYDREIVDPVIASVEFTYDQVNGGASGVVCVDDAGVDPFTDWSCPWTADNLEMAGDYYTVYARGTDNSGNTGSAITRQIYKSNLPVITGLQRNISGQPTRDFDVTDEWAYANSLTPNFTLEYTDDNSWSGASTYWFEWDEEGDGNWSTPSTSASTTLSYPAFGTYTLRVRITEEAATGYMLPYVEHTWSLMLENIPPIITEFDVVDFEGAPGSHLVSESANVVHDAQDGVGDDISGLDYGILSATGLSYGYWGVFADFSHTTSPYVWQIDGVYPFDTEPYCSQAWAGSADMWLILYRIYDKCGNWDETDDAVIKSDLPCVTLPAITYDNDCAQYDYGNGGIPVAFDGWSIIDDNNIAPFGFGWSFSGPFTGLDDPAWVDADELVDEAIEDMPELPWVWHFPEYGFYSARLIGTDDTGRKTSSDPVVVEISDCTAPEILEVIAPPNGSDFPLQVEICVSEPYDRDSGPAVDYVTIYASGTVIGTLYMADAGDHGWCFIWDSAGFDCGFYNIYATATDVNGNTSATSPSVTIEKLGGPPYGTAFGQDRYAGENNPSDIAFTVVAYDDCNSITEYHWNFGDGSPVEVTYVPEVTHSYAIGMYDCVVTVYNNAGFSDDAQARVSIADTTNPVVNSLGALGDCGAIDPLLDPEGWGAQCGVKWYRVDAIDMHGADAGILDVLELVIEDASVVYDTLTWTNPYPLDNAVVHDFDYDWDGLDSGPYTLTAIAYDYTVPPPNMSFPLVSITVYKSDPPHAEIDPEPVNGTYADEDTLVLTFSAYASHDDENGGAGGAIVLYEWDMDNDGTYEVSTPNPDPIELDYFSTGLGYGTYTVVLRVTDNTGLQDTDTVQVTIIDTTTPDVLFLVPRPGDVLTGLEPFEVDPAGTYDRGTMPEIVKVEYYVDAVWVGESWTAPNFPITVDFTVPPPNGYPGGPVELEARAYDLGGLTGSDTFTCYKSDAPVVDLPDWTDPCGPYGFGVFMTSPYAAQVDFSGYITDDNDHIYIWVNWDDGSPLQYLGQDVFTATHAYTTENVYNIQITVEDEYSGDGTTAGNIGEDSDDVSAIFIDDTPPTLSWFSPPNGTDCWSSPILLEVTGIADNYCVDNLDRVDFYVSIDGGDYTLEGTDNTIAGGTGAFSWSYDQQSYPAGTSFCFGATVWDLAQPNGNSFSVGLDGSICVTKNDVPWGLSIWTDVSGLPEAWVLIGTDVTYQGAFSNDGDFVSNYYWDWTCDGSPPWDEDNPNNIPVTIHTELPPWSVGDNCVRFAVEDECGISMIDDALHIYGDDAPVIDNFTPADLTFHGTTEIEFCFDVSDTWYWTDGTFVVVDVTDPGNPVTLLSEIFNSEFPLPVNDAAPPSAAEHFCFILSTQCLAAGTALEATVWVQDTEFNIDQVTHEVYIEDGEPPYMDEASWITPQQGDILDANEQAVIDVVVDPFDWHCTEIVEVRFYLDDYGWPEPEGAPWDIVYTPDASGEYAGYFTTTQNLNGWEDGDHRIGVKVWDSEGNESAYWTIGVTKVGAK